MIELLSLHEFLILLGYTLFWIWTIVDCVLYEPRKFIWLPVLIVPFGVSAYVILRVDGGTRSGVQILPTIAVCAYIVHRIRRRRRKEEAW